MFATMRYRYLLYRLAILLLLAAAILNKLGLDAVTDTYVDLFFLPAVIALLVFVVNAVWSRLQNRPDVEPVSIRCPVDGVWIAVNGPSSRVPSHGTDQFGQRFALDLTAYPDAGLRGFEPPSASTGFGAPVVAGVTGKVVAVSALQRDHRCRASRLGLLYLQGESAVRSLFGSLFVLGNHVTIRSTDGYYWTVAHLQRNSPQVAVGQSVSAGEVVGRCGNSGNSSEPHVHVQLSDRRFLSIAKGVPIVFADTTLPQVAVGDYAGIPRNGYTLTATPEKRSS